MSYQLLPPRPTRRRRGGGGLYAQLRADHRVLLGKINAFDRSRTAQSAHAMLRHVVEHLPAHAAMEEAYAVPGCNCQEHPIFHRIAVEGLNGNVVSAAAALSPMLRRHIATEETAWRHVEKAPPMVPLGQAPLLPVPKADPMKAMMTGLIIVILIMAFLWWLDQKNQKPMTPNRNRASKQSTKEMANNLYKRLEKRGGANPGTLRSLKALGRKQ